MYKRVLEKASCIIPLHVLNYTEDGADDADHHKKAAFNFVYVITWPKLSASHLIRKDRAWKKGDLVLNKT